MNKFSKGIKDLFGVGQSKAETEKVFKDPPNTAVFTTQFVVKDLKTTTYVSHDADDGAWQFFSDDEFENFNDVALMVALQQIVDLDATILEIANMPVGHYATRKDKSDTWTIHKEE